MRIDQLGQVEMNRLYNTFVSLGYDKVHLNTWHFFMRIFHCCDYIRGKIDLPNLALPEFEIFTSIIA